MASIPYAGSWTCCVPSPNEPHPEPAKLEEQHLEAKIRRAQASGPYSVTKDATVAEVSVTDGSVKVLREGTNGWTCFPGNENEIGNVPMCADKNGLQWIRDIAAKKPAPTNESLGIIYMLCGASQHSVTNAFDQSSPAIPIGPHYMIIWPFDAKRDGFPSMIRDQGAWVMFDGTPYAHLHVCGSPWDGMVYERGKTQANWNMRYQPFQDR
jgi:hypothetical protein